MRVLLIDVNCKDSSTGQIVYNLYSGIRQNGDTAAVCYGRGKKIDEENVYKFGIDVETYWHALMTRLTGLTGCFSFFSTRRLLRFIKKFKPDVVHVHELHAYFVNIKPVLRFLRKRNIKTVFTLHCDFLYTGKCGVAGDCNRWETACQNCPKIKEYPQSLLFDWTRRMHRQKRKLFDGWDNVTVVAPSTWMQERVKRSYLKDKTLVCAPNGIDESVFYPRDTKALRQRLHIDDEEKVVLALAPDLMSDNKGGARVLQIAGALQSEKIRFITIGIDGEIVNDMSNVIKMGRIYDKEQLAQYYSLADAFLICSKQETFPTTCLEAQCCGTPIYGFKAGGTQETALPINQEHFVAVGDMQKLTTLIKNAPMKTEQMVKQISQEAIKEYSNEAMVENYYQIYKQA